ncbi:MAG TPA: 1-acyl-sn-glycerol-3-phosphate acyltransferase [Deltaproteobacteria bacterium]|jgi:1-acyl-sn-glycerol-3-phosphate acyltransferase|nr:1-acyl-sn-glycerol-3-phosphate acyltransferase [Deltaproteobacteria bacterium]
MTLLESARTAVAMGTVALDTLVFAPSAIMASLALGPTHPLVSRFYRDFASVALAGFGARVRASGEERLHADERYVFVSNHSSHLDALAILSSLPRHGLRFVAKDQLGRVPLFGAALRTTGNVFVARSDTQRDVQALDAARDQLLRHISVLFFAEGHRSETGALGPFKKGAAMFALKTGLPLVPIGVQGAFEIYSRGYEVRRGGTIGVSIGSPIELEGRSIEERDEVTEELRRAVIEEIGHARKLAEL